MKYHQRDFYNSGKHFHSLAECARITHISYNTLKHRVRKYGRENPKILKRGKTRHGVILAGMWYPSVSEAAYEHDLKVNTLFKRIKKFGKDNKQIFNTVK